jgi:hypothetical protein
MGAPLNEFLNERLDMIRDLCAVEKFKGVELRVVIPD